MATKTIKIGDKNADMLATGATPIFFKEMFKADLLQSINGTIDEDGNGILSAEIIGKLGFILAKQADGLDFEKAQSLTEAEYVNWLNKYDFGALMAAAPDILATLQEQERTSVELKKTPT